MNSSPNPDRGQAKIREIAFRPKVIITTTGVTLETGSYSIKTKAWIPSGLQKQD